MSLFFFFNDTATTEIYSLSLHDALPIYPERARAVAVRAARVHRGAPAARAGPGVGRPPGQHAHGRRERRAALRPRRSEEHTSELQSRQYLVCRLLLEKKKNRATTTDRGR